MPPEKKEAIIYLLPSAAIAIWISSVSLVDTALTEWLALTGLMASILALFFSMINFDVYVIRKWLRMDVKKRQRNGLMESIPTFNILLQSWQVSSEPSTDSEWIDRWITNCVGDAVASYPVRTRSWYLRFSLSSSLAIIILFIMPYASNLLGLQSTFFISIQSENVSILQWILTIAMVAGFFLPWIANYWRDYHGNKSFTRDTRFVAEFQYLQYLIGLDYIRRPEYYTGNSSLSSLKQELEKLQLFLYRGDWSIFVRSWHHLRLGLIDNVNERINTLYYPDLLILWTDIVIGLPLRIHSKRRLELLLRISSHKPPTGLANEVIKLISEDGVLKDISAVNIVEFFTSERKQKHRDIRTAIRSYFATTKFPMYMNDRLNLLHNRLNRLGVKFESI